MNSRGWVVGAIQLDFAKIDDNGSSIAVQSLWLMQYNLDAVRINSLPSATAGQAMVSSFKRFVPSNLYFGPALTTYVKPSSLRQKIIPLYAHGEAVNEPPGEKRRLR